MRYRFSALTVLILGLIGSLPQQAAAFQIAPEGFRCQFDSSVGAATPLSLARSILNEDDIRPTPLQEPLRRQVARSESPYVVPTFDIPMVINAQVVKWLNYFQGSGRKHFTRWLSRFDRYSPMIIEALRKHGVPEDMVYLAMIESGFQPSATSHASAAGMWQFMRHTGSLYGLRVDWWVDERRDPFKATLAAARHLSDLFEQFNDWYLVAAGYNAGAGKVQRAIRRYNTEDFWQLTKFRYLRSETRNYVPKLLAAAIIAKHPEAYGFRGIQYHDPLEFEIFPVDQFSDLQKIAAAIGMDMQALKELNPELRRSFTPVDNLPYPLRVPPGTAAILEPLQEQEQFKAELRHAYSLHKVRRGESLHSVARHYGVSSMALAEINGLPYSRKRTPRIVQGSEIRVPAPGQAALEPSRIRRASYRTERGNNYEKVGGNIRYRVSGGDTLWDIAKRFNLPVSEIKRLNPQIRGNKIYRGMQLKLRKSS